MSSTEHSELLNENDLNGSVLQGKFIPEELLKEILFRVDRETVPACQLVCKRWLLLFQEKNFGKNLIKNKVNFRSCWNIISISHSGNIDWKVELTPLNAPPYPTDPVIKKINMCYVPCSINRWKGQTIDLVQEGFPECVLDAIQPTVTVSEWYTCERGGWASYKCLIELILQRDENTVLVRDSFCTELHDNQNKWFRYEHKFENYGIGLRKINFFHGGESDVWKVKEDNHKCKMAGACITLEFSGRGPNTAEGN